MAGISYEVLSSELLSLEESHLWNIFIILFQQPTDLGVEVKAKLMEGKLGIYLGCRSKRGTKTSLE